MSQVIIMATIIIYLVAVVIIGVVCSKKNNAVDDFYLGGRKLGPFVTAMSAEASDMSSWLLMGLPGLAYLTGVADAAWTAIGLAIGTYVNWLIVAKRIRKYTQGYDTFTIIHGLGSGILRKNIAEYLKTNKYVESFRSGGQNEGGMGATVVEMK